MLLIVLYNLKLWWVFLKPLFEEFKYLIFFYITNSIKDSMGETRIWNTLLNKVQSLFVYLFSFSFFFHITEIKIDFMITCSQTTQLT